MAVAVISKLSEGAGLQYYKIDKKYIIRVFLLSFKLQDFAVKWKI